MKIDYINSWKKGNKQVWKGDITLRFGRITLLEIAWNLKTKSIRLMLLNFGIEITY
jgi:hypothetical protein|tara:strand:+ start:234 stop:401 length:168 start_codon:yes stop_codon:yes gene_type:complete